MDVKEAAILAKTYVADLFSDEKPMNIGLEEVEYLEGPGRWLVTVGFSRSWNREQQSPYDTMLNVAGVLPKRMTRDYKVVTIDDATNEVTSVKKHE